MLDSVLLTIEKHKMLSKDDSVLLGLSGGADSVLLFHILLALRDKLGIKLCAAHINHCLRGRDSEADELFCKQLCEKNGICLKVFNARVKELANKRGMGLEEAGRAVRYECFEKASKEFGSNKIALAHNKNDNAETILMRMCRGTGLTGLRGIPAIRGDIIRPLIETERHEIERYLSENNISYRTDNSNSSDEFLRNRVRMLLPFMETAIGGVNLVEKLWQTSRICEAEDDFLIKFTDEAFKLCLLNRRQDCLSLNIDELKRLNPAICLRVIRQALENWSLTDITQKHVMAISRLLNSRSGKSIKLFDIVIERSFNRLRFSPAAKYNLKPGFCYNIPLNELVFIPELNRYFYLSEQSPVGAIIDNPLKKSEIVCTKSFIYHKMKDVQIRSRKMGDTINIRHIGHVKLKDYFVNNKIPKYERDEIGLLTCGSEVVWIMDKKSIVHADYEPDSGLRQIHIFVWEDYSERGYQDADFRERD